MHSPLRGKDHGDFGTAHIISIKITLNLRKNIARAIHCRVRICITKKYSGAKHPNADCSQRDELRCGKKQPVFAMSLTAYPLPLPFINRLGNASLARETADADVDGYAQ